MNPPPPPLPVRAWCSRCHGMGTKWWRVCRQCNGVGTIWITGMKR